MKSNDEHLARFNEFRVTLSTEYPEQQVFLKSIHDSISIAHSGDIVVLSGPSKSGKSGICAALIAACLRTEGEVDTIGFISPTNKGEAVLVFNTELSNRNFQRYYVTILRRLGSESDNELLFAYNLNGMDASTLQEYTFEIIQAVRKSYRIKAVVIDGIADYVAEVNNERACKELIDNLMLLGRKLDFPMVLVIHFNPGSEKTRGHLGSFLERKCEVFLEIKPTKLNNTFMLQAKFLRNARNFQPVYFRFDEKSQYHRFAFTHNDIKVRTEQERQDALDNKTMEDILVYYAGQDVLPQKELIKRIMEKDKVGSDAARKRVKKYVVDEFLIVSKEGSLKINFIVDEDEEEAED